jgi:hypothetical protein
LIVLTAGTLLSGCVTSNGNNLLLDTVGPPMSQLTTMSSISTNGTLLVYSAYRRNADFNSRDPYRQEYSDCEFSTTEGRLQQRVRNNSGTELQNVVLVTFPAGKYQVKARANDYGFVTVPVKFREMSNLQPGGTSAQIRERVISARQIQQARFADKPKVTCNTRMAVFPLPHCPSRNPRDLSHFGLGQVRFKALRKEVVAQGFDIDWNQLSRAKSLQWTVKNCHHSSLCNSQQLTQPPLARSVPLSRFTPRVGRAVWAGKNLARKVRACLDKAMPTKASVQTTVHAPCTQCGRMHS